MMEDELFGEYQMVRGRLGWLIEKTSRKEVLQLLAEDFDIDIFDAKPGEGDYTPD